MFCCSSHPDDEPVRNNGNAKSVAKNNIQNSKSIATSTAVSIGTPNNRNVLASSSKSKSSDYDGSMLKKDANNNTTSTSNLNENNESHASHNNNSAKKQLDPYTISQLKNINITTTTTTANADDEDLNLDREEENHIRKKSKQHHKHSHDKHSNKNKTHHNKTKKKIRTSKIDKNDDFDDEYYADTEVKVNQDDLKKELDDEEDFYNADNSSVSTSHEINSSLLEKSQHTPHAGENSTMVDEESNINKGDNNNIQNDNNNNIIVNNNPNDNLQGSLGGDSDYILDLTALQPDQYHAPGCSSLLPPKDSKDKHKKCLILDLDETLVHSSFKFINNPDFILPIEIEDGQIHNVYVIKRPGVDRFLREVKKWYEIVIFTASLSRYANPLLDLLDKDHNLINHRLFRDACYNYENNFIKNLSQIGRPLHDIIILDNSPASYIFHPQHAIPISSWFSDTHDNELIDILPLLKDLSHVSVDDVGKILDVTI